MKSDDKFVVMAPMMLVFGFVSGLVVQGQRQEATSNSLHVTSSAEPKTGHILIEDSNDWTVIGQLFDAVAMVESSGGKNLYGSTDDVGIVQITPICLKDCNIIVGYTKWTLADRLDTRASREMFETYLYHYYPHGNQEQWARLWHRGPSKARQYDSYGDTYWKKVKAEL